MNSSKIILSNFPALVAPFIPLLVKEGSRLAKFTSFQATAEGVLSIAPANLIIKWFR
ncbi:hypothetical protein [Tenacibaculum sp. 190524A02b]|uniref:hypothetical protein n=1 Tax=Tenacibaculum vairaonense TaxID=3137860 RepID=UPI0032B27D63